MSFRTIALTQATCAVEDWDMFNRAAFGPDAGTDILAAVGRLYRQGMEDDHPHLTEVYNANGPKLVECLLGSVYPHGWLADHQQAVDDGGWLEAGGVHPWAVDQASDLDEALLAIWAAKQVAGYRSERFDTLVEGVNRCRDALLAEPGLYREAADWAARHVEARDRMLAYTWSELYAGSRWLETLAAEA